MGKASLRKTLDNVIIRFSSDTAGKDDFSHADLKLKGNWSPKDVKGGGRVGG